MPKRTLKIKDKWKEKTWLQVEAPLIFGNKIIAKVPVTETDKAVGRTIETTLFDLMGEDEEQYSIKLKFQIERVEDKVAKTNFKQFELARETLKSLIRKGSSIVDFYKDIETRDGAKLRIFVIIYTASRVNTSRKKAIRKIADRIVEAKAKKLSFGPFVLESVLGKIASEIFNESKRVSKIRYSSVRKLKVLSYPKQEERVYPVSP